MSETSIEVNAAYKWLSPDYQGAYGRGDYTDYLPKGARPGKWLPKIANPKPCQRGYHIVKIADLRSHWGSVGSVLFEVETRGVVVPDTDKSVCESIRLTKRLGILTEDVLISFAIECAERVLSIFEAKYPNDGRPRKAIKAARSRDPNAAYAAATAPYAADAAAYGAYAAATAPYAAYAAAYAADAAAYAAYAAATAPYTADAAAYGAANAAAAAIGANAANAAAAIGANAANAAAAAIGANAAEREWQGKRLLELFNE